MPLVIDNELRFVYSVGPTRLLAESGEVVSLEFPPVAVENFRGGSQAISFDGGWLMLIHEWQVIQHRRHYFHRFVWLDENCQLRRLSKRFYFQRIASEFAAGLAWHVIAGRLIVSFGVDDREPTLAVVDADEVRATLLDVEVHQKASDEACEAGRLAWKKLADEVQNTLSSQVRKAVWPETSTPPQTIADGKVATIANRPPARLITAFGTVVYVDLDSGELRHGRIETSPANVVFVADSSSAGAKLRGALMRDLGGAYEPILCGAERCVSRSKANASSQSVEATRLELIPLERGLVAIGAGDLFLSSIPNGVVRLSAPTCSTWELFLASEAWCSATTANDEGPIAYHNQTKFNRKAIENYIIHPVHRIRANTKPQARKILIFGYPRWSHGRVYYDLCKRLHRHGYVVDLLDWQGHHDDYLHLLGQYYDLFMSALDGVSHLIDHFQVPPDRIIGISHHENDIRMLLEQKGVDVFDRLGNYGVVSEFVYAASLMRGVPRGAHGGPAGRQLLRIRFRHSRAIGERGICLFDVRHDVRRRVETRRTGRGGRARRGTCIQGRGVHGESNVVS